MPERVGSGAVRTRAGLAIAVALVAFARAGIGRRNVAPPRPAAERREGRSSGAPGSPPGPPRRRGDPLAVPDQRSRERARSSS